MYGQVDSTWQYLCSTDDGYIIPLYGTVCICGYIPDGGVQLHVVHSTRYSRAQIVLRMYIPGSRRQYHMRWYITQCFIYTSSCIHLRSHATPVLRSITPDRIAGCITYALHMHVSISMLQLLHTTEILQYYVTEVLPVLDTCRTVVHQPSVVCWCSAVLSRDNHI